MEIYRILRQLRKEEYINNIKANALTDCANI